MANKILKFLLSSQDSNAFLDEAKLAAKGCEGVNGICSDYSGNIYVADAKKHAIFKITGHGSVHLFAGQVGVFGNNGSDTVKASEAKFNTPGGLTCDKSGNIYVADTGNNQIRKIDYNGRTSLVAGDPDGAAGYVDDGFTTSKFNAPRDVFVDNSNNVYVADTFNHCVRLISVSKNAVLTIAGDGTPGDAVGLGGIARFNRPSAIVGDIGGRIYIADNENFKIKTLLPNGMVYHFSGSGVMGNTIGNAATAQYQNVKFMAAEKTGNLFLVDVDPDEINDSRLLRIDSNGNPAIVSNFSNANKYLVSGVAVTPGQAIFVTQSDYSQFDSTGLLCDANETYDIDDQDGTITHINVKYNGDTDTTCTVIINGESVVVGDVAGDFVFDIGGSQERTFNTIGEFTNAVIGGKLVEITYSGVGCHLFNLTLYGSAVKVPTDYATIQEAVNNVSNDDIIVVAPGTYNETVTINKQIHLIGSGSGDNPLLDTICNGTNGIIIESGGVSETERLMIKDIRIEATPSTDCILVGASSSQDMHVNYLTLKNITAVNSRNGINFQCGGNFFVNSIDIIVEDSSFSHNAEMGLRASYTSNINGLTVINSHFDYNRMGWFSQNRSPDTFQGITDFKNLNIQNTTFNNNSERGLHLYKLDDAIFDHITVDGNGATAIAYNCGFEINLKYTDYENITITNSTIINNGLGETQGIGYGLSIKARDDAPSYSTYPATLTNVTITNNIISGNQIGVGIGEKDKNAINNPSNITFNNNNINDNVNYALANYMTTSLDAKNNWWGTIASSEIADMISGNVVWAPFLIEPFSA